MSVIITRSLFTTVVTPGEEIITRIPFFRGERLVVQPDHDADDTFDWLRTADGRLVALPPEAWTPVSLD